jgi:hypothetical protein
MSTDVLEQLATALTPILEQQKARQYGVNPFNLGSGQKHDATGNPITVGFNHGPGGILTFPGVDPTLFHTMYGNASILGMLPTMPSVYTNPTYMTLTGVGDDEGNEKDEVCDNAPVAGLLAGCMLTSVFGRYERATPELELNRLGQRNDRADPLDLTLVGSPIASSGIFNTGAQGAQAPADVLVNEVSRKFWERNISLWRLMSRQLWIGNPANNSAGGGYKEMTGFSVLVNTGHVDAETGAACRNLDSLIVNANYQRIDASDGLVAMVTSVYHNLYRKAELSGILPVRWVIAMRSQLFYELTNIWPCSYLSFRCSTVLDITGGNHMRGNIDAQDAIRFRDEMRAGKYLLIDGQRVEVVLDEGIPESSNTTNSSVTSGCFSSDIYFIPMSVTGGRAVTFLEYFDYGNPSLMSALGDGMTIGRREGAFLTTMRQTNWCLVWQTKVEPRLVMRTPWLAARIQNVMYCPAIHDPDPFPGDPYFVNEGRTSRAGPSLYSHWA